MDLPRVQVDEQEAAQIARAKQLGNIFLKYYDMLEYGEDEYDIKFTGNRSKLYKHIIIERYEDRRVKFEFVFEYVIEDEPTRGEKREMLVKEKLIYRDELGNETELSMERFFPIVVISIKDIPTSKIESYSIMNYQLYEQSEDLISGDTEAKARTDIALSVMEAWAREREEERAKTPVQD